MDERESKRLRNLRRREGHERRANDCALFCIGFTVLFVISIIIYALGIKAMVGPMIIFLVFAVLNAILYAYNKSGESYYTNNPYIK